MSNVMFDRMWAQDRIAKAKETIREYEGHLAGQLSEEDRNWVAKALETRKADLEFLKGEYKKTLY